MSALNFAKLNSFLMSKNEVISYNQTISKLNNLPFYIESTQGIQIHELKAQARKMKRNYDVQTISIDYISLIAVQQNNIPPF